MEIAALPNYRETLQEGSIVAGQREKRGKTATSQDGMPHTRINARTNLACLDAAWLVSGTRTGIGFVGPDDEHRDFQPVSYAIDRLPVEQVAHQTMSV